MAQRVVEPLFEVTISIIGGQQGGFVLPQVTFCYLSIFELGHSIAQGIVPVLDRVFRRLHLLEPALAVVIISGDFGAGGFLAQAAVAVVGVMGIALTLQLVAEVVARGCAGYAPLGAGGQGAVAVGVVLVLLYQLAVFGHAREAIAVIVGVAVLVDLSALEGLGFTNNLANAVVGQIIAEGGRLIQVGADVRHFPIAVVGNGSVQGAIAQADGQALVGIAANGEAVNAGEQAVPVVGQVCAVTGVGELADLEVGIVIVLDALVEFALVPDFLQQAAVPGVGQGFTAFADLAELITVLIGVEDGTLGRVGLGQPVLAVEVLQSLAGGQFNGGEAAVAVVLVVCGFAQRGGVGGDPVDAIKRAGMVSGCGHHQRGLVAVGIVLTERGVAIGVGDLGYPA